MSSKSSNPAHGLFAHVFRLALDITPGVKAGLILAYIATAITLIVEAPRLDATRAFVLSNIAKGVPQFVAVAGGSVVGWCDITPMEDEGFRHRGRLGMGVEAGEKAAPDAGSGEHLAVNRCGKRGVESDEGSVQKAERVERDRVRETVFYSILREHAVRYSGNLFIGFVRAPYLHLVRQRRGFHEEVDRFGRKDAACTLELGGKEGFPDVSLFRIVVPQLF